MSHPELVQTRVCCIFCIATSFSAAAYSNSKEKNCETKEQVESELLDISESLLPYINESPYPKESSTEQLEVEVTFAYRGFDLPIVHRLHRQSKEQDWKFSGLEKPFHSILLRMDKCAEQAKKFGLNRC